MKKYMFIMILLLPLLVTGCFGSEGKGNLTSVCTKEEESYNVKETDTYTIEYFKGSVVTITLKKDFSGLDVNRSLETYQKAYENNVGVSSNIGDNNITYTFDLSQTDDDIMSIFNLKKVYNEQIKVLENKGFTCN